MSSAAVPPLFEARPLAADAIGPWREMSELQAVRAGHVRVNEDFVPHASQRMLQTAELFARILHPEVP